MTRLGQLDPSFLEVQERDERAKSVPAVCHESDQYLLTYLASPTAMPRPWQSFTPWTPDIAPKFSRHSVQPSHPRRRCRHAAQ